MPSLASAPWTLEIPLSVSTILTADPLTLRGSRPHRPSTPICAARWRSGKWRGVKRAFLRIACQGRGGWRSLRIPIRSLVRGCCCERRSIDEALRGDAEIRRRTSDDPKTGLVGVESEADIKIVSRIVSIRHLTEGGRMFEKVVDGPVNIGHFNRVLWISLADSDPRLQCVFIRNSRAQWAKTHPNRLCTGQTKPISDRKASA